MMIIVGNEESTEGVRCFLVSRAHLNSISHQWSGKIERNTQKGYWYQPWRRPKCEKYIVLADDDPHAVGEKIYEKRIYDSKQTLMFHLRF